MSVLILVFVEDGLRPFQIPHPHFDSENCLNPCFCGRWSATICYDYISISQRIVLILVFVEDGLRLVAPATGHPLCKRS